jgi:hypothetical protein
MAVWHRGPGVAGRPERRSVEHLKTQGKDFTVVTFPVLAMVSSTPLPPTPQAPTLFVEWVEKRIHTEAKRS